jgi:hypothetical protein
MYLKEKLHKLQDHILTYQYVGNSVMKVYGCQLYSQNGK